MKTIENKFIANRIQRVVANNKEILVTDYSNNKEADMIKKIVGLGEFVKKENKPVLLLFIFNEKSYATPAFIKKSTQVYLETSHLIEKRALIGLNLAKKMILKGHNIQPTTTRGFDSMEEALVYLLEEAVVVPKPIR